MTRKRREGDRRVRGLGLAPRFVLSMSLAMAAVMGVAAALLYVGSTNLAEKLVEDTIASGVRLSHKKPIFEAAPSALDLQHGVKKTQIKFGERLDERGVVYWNTDEKGQTYRFFVPQGQKLGPRMRGLIVGILVMLLLVGAGVALWAAKSVTRPIHRLVADVRQIAAGDLSHRTNAVGAGEVELLARSIDRMTRDLEAAQEAEVELSIREREMEVAAGVREALLPLTTPLLAGYDIGGTHISGSEGIGGDFHDFFELAPDRVGMLVCDVSGQGVPAALVGATARSYLRSELARGGDPLGCFRSVNKWLSEDVRRGMYVTALYVLLDGHDGIASVLCAGHKVPLLRYSAEDGKLRTVHPEGIAFGFDKGPVFDRRLEMQRVPVAKGDRLLLANSAPLRITNPDGRELGEKTLYQRFLRYAKEDTRSFLKALKCDLVAFAGEDGVPFDISLVTVCREKES